MEIKRCAKSPQPYPRLGMLVSLARVVAVEMVKHSWVLNQFPKLNKQCLPTDRVRSKGTESPKSFLEPTWGQLLPSIHCSGLLPVYNFFLLISLHIPLHESPRISWADSKNDHCLGRWKARP